MPKTTPPPTGKKHGGGDADHEEKAVHFIVQRAQDVLEYYTSMVPQVKLYKRTATSNECSRYRQIITNTWKVLVKAAQDSLREQTAEKRRREGTGSLFKCLAKLLFKKVQDK